jgi:hypothetical protein
MKRLVFTVVIIVLNLGLLSWTLAQGTRSDLFDLRKAQQELEIMKGILNTTLDFAARDMRERGQGAEGRSTGYREAEILHSWGGGSITAFYLYGQGATFMIPTGRFRTSRMRRDLASQYIVAEHDSQEAMEDFEDALEEVKESQEMLQERLEETARLHAEAALAGAPPPPAPPAPPAPPKPAAQVKAAPQPAPEPKQKTEEMRKKVFLAQEKLKQRQAEVEQRRQKFLEALGQAKVQLVEALANHGDSLSFVKPNEYVNLVLTTDEGEAFLEGSRGGRREIISVQRSAVSDYKAGKLTLEAFKQKVLQYTN